MSTLITKTASRTILIPTALSIAALALGSSYASAWTVQKQGHGQQGGGHQGGGSHQGGGGAPSPAPAPAPAPAPTQHSQSPPPAPPPRPTPTPQAGPIINQAPPQVTRPTIPDRNPVPNNSRFPNGNPNSNYDNRPEFGPRPPVNSAPGRGNDSPGSDSPGNAPSRQPSTHDYNNPRPENYNNPSPSSNNRPPITSGPSNQASPHSPENYDRPSNTDAPREGTNFSHPAKWRVRYSDAATTNKNNGAGAPPTISNNNGSGSNNNGSGSNNNGSGSNNNGSGIPATGNDGLRVHPKEQGGANPNIPLVNNEQTGGSRGRYKNASPRPEISGEAPKRHLPSASENPTINNTFKNTNNNNGLSNNRRTAPAAETAGTVTSSVPKHRPAVAEHRVKADAATVETTAKIVSKAAKTTKASKASKAFVAGLFSGGFGVSGTLGTSAAASTGFSWYNFVNYGYGGPGSFGLSAYYGCNSYANWYHGCCSTYSLAGFAFFIGSPWWWSYPSCYLSSYYSPWYSGSYGFGYYHHKPFGYSYGYPAYYYYPYDYPSTVVYQTETIYYPEVHESTTYVPYEAERKYGNGGQYGSSGQAEAAPQSVANEGEQPVGRPRVAQGEHKSAGQPSPNSLLADRYAGLGDIYFRLGHYERAVESYRRALSYDSSDANLHFILSDGLFSVGNYSEAAAEITRAIKIDAGLVESNANKNDFYGVAADFDIHIQSLERWLNDHPDDADAWLVLGYNRYFKKDYSLARVAFDRARQLASQETRRAAELFLAVTDVRIAENK
ncbi:MAG: tetratricopeptide repeat protein [Planctomycetes bacterium]|nr:tetratricopeptide repeat protein [Planctomycetota bacterium]